MADSTAPSAHRPRGSDDFGVFDDAKTYYASDERHTGRYANRTRTYSQASSIYRHVMVATQLTQTPEQFDQTNRANEPAGALSPWKSRYVARIERDAV